VYWKWFEDFFGGVVYSPPPRLPEGDGVVRTGDNPAMKNLPATFRNIRRWYEFDRSPRPNVRVLAPLTKEPTGRLGDGRSPDHLDQ